MASGAPDHPSVARVTTYAAERGVAIQVVRFGASTRTADDAAREIGTTVERIVKSLVFVADGATVVVLCSGASRVDPAKLARVLEATEVRRATADEAKDATGYAIGGVPPFAHARPCPVICDPGLLAYDEVWAAAGLHDAVFAIAPADLVRVSGASIQDVATR